MNSLLVEIYSTIIPSAPYLIAAYVLIMIVLFAVIFITLSHVKKAEAQLTILEEELQERDNSID